VSVAARLQRLERSRPPCPGCLRAAALVRWRDDADPPEAPPCPTCGRPQAQTLVREIIVDRVGGVLLFTSPPLMRFVSPDDVRELMHDADSALWAEAEARARRRQAAGEQPYYHTPGHRTP
jgi:hypothetical protein